MKPYLWALLLLTIANWATAQAKLAIVIDDLGNHYDYGKQAIMLPGPISVAILPLRPYSKILAELAYQQQKTILVHQPMSNTVGKLAGAGSLNETMNYHQFHQQLKQNLTSVPYAEGLNNHMGSRLTQRITPMLWLMDELKQRQLFFIDSRTTHHTVASEIATTVGIPIAKRDIFLDNDKQQSELNAQWQKAIKKAKQKGLVIVIAHPYSETLQFLRTTLPRLKALNIRLVDIKEALDYPESTISLQTQPPHIPNKH